MQPSYTQFALRLRRVGGPILIGARPMHNSRDVTICGLSDLMRPPAFVKLNALEDLGGGAFTFSIHTELLFPIGI